MPISVLPSGPVGLAAPGSECNAAGGGDGDLIAFVEADGGVDRGALGDGSAGDGDIFGDVFGLLLVAAGFANVVEFQLQRAIGAGDREAGGGDVADDGEAGGDDHVIGDPLADFAGVVVGELGLEIVDDFLQPQLFFILRGFDFAFELGFEFPGPILARAAWAFSRSAKESEARSLM